MKGANNNNPLLAENNKQQKHMSNNNNVSNYSITIVGESFEYSAKERKAISTGAEKIADRITINENLFLTAQEEIAVIKAEAVEAIKAGVKPDEIALALKAAGFSEQKISALLLKYGIKRNAGKQNKGEKSKAVQALADLLKETAEENANNVDQAVAALRRAADQLRDEAKKSKGNK